MKLIPLSIAALALGGTLGFVLARVEVGEVTQRLAPPAAESETPLPPPGASAAGPEATSPDAPAFSVDTELYDFGTMQRGSSKSHEFTITNTGKRPLTLEVGRTSCKCTLGNVTDRPLEPGESTPVRLQWTARSLPGGFRQVATIHTNDPVRPSVNLTVEGIVTENTSIQPREFLLGRVAADEVGTAVVYIASFDEDAPQLEADVTVGEHTASSDRYQFETESVSLDELPIKGATSGVRITLRAGPGLPIGNLGEWVTIQTNRTESDGETPHKLQVPMMGTVAGDITLHGAGWSKEKGLLNLGKIASSAGREAKLRVSFKGDHAADLRAEFATADPPWLEVELDEPVKVRDGVYHQPMVVRVPAGKQAIVRSGAGEENGGFGDGDARIRLSINHPATSELDMRVRFVIAE